jgi:hypothetical protein
MAGRGGVAAIGGAAVGFVEKLRGGGRAGNAEYESRHSSGVSPSRERQRLEKSKSTRWRSRLRSDPCRSKNKKRAPDGSALKWKIEAGVGRRGYFFAAS